MLIGLEVLVVLVVLVMVLVEEYGGGVACGIGARGGVDGETGSVHYY